MASYSTIRFNFVQAKQQAQRLETMAQEMRTAANKNFDTAIAELQSGWKGESADEYIRKAQTVKSDILATARDIETVAANIRKVAQKIYNAEMEAKRLAEEISRRM